MSTGIWSAASGAVAQTTALDVAANNIANATTPGYRADRAIFRQELNQALGAAVGTRSQRYAIVRTVEPDRRQGALNSTGRSLDVALRDPDHWLAVSTPQGERYTRSGALQLAADGTLRTPEGATYVGSNHKPIKVPPNAQSVAVNATGNIIVDGLDTGSRLHTVSFARSAGLVKEGAVLVRALPNAARPVNVDPDLEPGALETSNASALSGMTSLVQASREFEMMTKVIQAFSELEKLTAQQVGRGR